MKREINQLARHTGGCCPGHDKFPSGTYNTRTSMKARSRDKKVEHQIARSKAKRILLKQVHTDT